MKSNAQLWIVKQIKNRLPAITVMTAAQVGHALFCVLFALGSRNVIDSAVACDQALFTAACLKQLAVISGILICLTVVRHLRERLRADLERDWKQRLLNGLLHGEYSEVSSYHSAELINRLNNDVAKVNDGVLAIIPNSAAMVTRLVAAVIVLGTLDIRFTVCMVVLGIVVIGITGLMRHRLKELNKQVSEQDGKVSGYLQETMEKLLVVQAMDISNEVEHRAEVLLNARYELQRRRKNVSLIANTSISLMYYGANFLALCWCAGRMLHGQMSFGSLTAVIQLVNQLQTPIVNLSGIMPQYIAMVASAERLMELEKIQGEPEPAEEEPQEIYSRMERICAEDLCFSYDRDVMLDGAGFTLPKGIFTVITGPSGIGKSTILKLLLGVIRPADGEMYLMTRCDEKIRLSRSTRRLFAYVPQGNMLLSGTVRDNLTIVKPEASEEELRQAVYVSGMDEFLPKLPRGLDTDLGEDGMGLSEGQAQRVAIARAVLGDAPILLLDECTSALDEQMEKMVLQRLRELPNRTCIAVTHRPAAIALCDCQLEVEKGRIHLVRSLEK